MKQLGLSFFTDIHLTVIGLILFFSVFIGVTLFVYRKNSESVYKKISQLPLEESRYER